MFKLLLTMKLRCVKNWAWTWSTLNVFFANFCVMLLTDNM